MANYLAIPTSSGCSTPNQSAFNPGTNTFEAIAQVQMVNWVPSGSSAYIFSCSWDASSANSRWTFDITTAGLLGLVWYENGAVSLQNAPSTVATGFAANSTHWVRAVVTPSAGTVSYWTSPAGASPTWTQLGTTRTGLSTNAVHVPTSPQIAVIGQNDAGANQWLGNVLNLQYIVNSVAVIDQDWTIATPGTGPWTGGTGETWTAIGTANVVGSAAPTAHNLMLMGVGA